MTGQHETYSGLTLGFANRDSWGVCSYSMPVLQMSFFLYNG